MLHLDLLIYVWWQLFDKYEEMFSEAVDSFIRRLQAIKRSLENAF